MKKIILMIFVSLVILSPVHAGEEILLAAAIGDSNANKDDAIAAYRPSGSLRYGTQQSQSLISSRVIIGTIMVGFLAVIVEGGSDSTSNH